MGHVWEGGEFTVRDHWQFEWSWRAEHLIGEDLREGSLSTDHCVEFCLKEKQKKCGKWEKNRSFADKNDPFGIENHCR